MGTRLECIHSRDERIRATLTDLRDIVLAVPRGLAELVAKSPVTPWLLRRGAVLPVSLKLRLLYRILAALARRSNASDLMIETNLGISDDLRVLIPSKKSILAFGRPEFFVPERATLALAVHLAARSDCFLDIGANEGLFTFAVAEALGRGAREGIHAFEPDDVLHDRLSDNLDANRIPVKLNKVAVGSRSGFQTFYRNLDDDLSGSLSNSFVGTQRMLPTDAQVTSLADYLSNRALSHACIKVDVEGAGLAVWEGTSGVRDRIDWLIYEIVRPEVEACLCQRIIIETGWHAYYIRDYELIHSSDGSFDYREPFYNWLFCREDPRRLRDVVAQSGFSVYA